MSIGGRGPHGTHLTLALCQTKQNAFFEKVVIFNSSFGVQHSKNLTFANSPLGVARTNHLTLEW